MNKVIPKKLKVGAHELKIHQMALLDAGGGTANVNTATGDIHIDEGLSNTIKWDGIIHEVVEFGNVMYNWDMPHDIITSLGIFMHQFIADNMEKLYGKETGNKDTG